MEGLPTTTDQTEIISEYSFKKLFVPFTSLKAVHWIIFIGIVVYFNALLNGFVWDDLTFMINNPIIHVINIPIFLASIINTTE